ncbi:hypothetical protein POM88_002665 [Heracleum sosnowskyi]|uniref:Uncharacterized protein n=1 Tax=Heracleum sosnowskyi TaxID=360622 RepID=A0AAD8JIV6_9APIA|nr:hypothetical protein POM88_002665 [Heracleum sosnowskyi]
MSSPSHQFVFSNYSTQVNVALINFTPLRAQENGNHAIVGIFGIAVTVLLTALQLKYQTDSPFHDHPKAMALAIASFLIFCLACDVEQYFRTSHRYSSFAELLKHVLRLMGFMSLASLASVVFSTSTSSTASFIVYTVFPWFFSVSLILFWIQKRKLHRNRGVGHFNNLSPHIVYTDHYSYSYIDTLPVYRV